jgi:hypothetical protein
MNHVTTIKMLKVAGPMVETELFVEEELELGLFGEGTLQIIKTPDDQSFLVSPDEVRKLIIGLQKGLSKLAPSSGSSKHLARRKVLKNDTLSSCAIISSQSVRWLIAVNSLLRYVLTVFRLSREAHLGREEHPR